LSTAPPTIVLAEDNDNLRELIKHVLTAHGYHVLEAADGVQLVRRVAESEVDAVIVDVRLGADDGISLGRELRELQPGIPIALISGDSSQAGAMKRAAGLTDLFLSKPFSAEELANAVKRLLA
jgi:DNA-binding response OmpR family regulator